MKSEKSFKRHKLVDSLSMGQQTDSQGAAGVVESESTWFCETHAGYDIFDVTSMFIL